MTEEQARNRMMDYLYDEMEPGEQAEFEAYLDDHPELREELRQMQQTRNMMEHLSLDEPSRKMVLLDADQPEENGNGRIMSRLMKFSLAAAAILLGGILLFAYANVQVGQTDRGLYLTFGGTPSALSQSVTEDDVITLMEQIRAENQAMMAALTEQVREQQNEQLDETITLLTAYYEQQRQQDLLFIAESMARFEEDTYYRFLQTDEALGEIFYALGNQ